MRHAVPACIAAIAVVLIAAVGLAHASTPVCPSAHCLFLPLLGQRQAGLLATATSTATLTPTATPISTATTTSSSTSAATLTATAMATAKATATATPTATVPPATPSSRDCSGVYPIGISDNLLAQGEFLPPSDPEELQFYKIYHDPIYGAHTQRRIYLNAHDDGFAFLSWGASSNALVLATALTSTGTLEQGFEEVVPWPDWTTSPPSDYPLHPGRLNTGDWIHTPDDVSMSADMMAAFEYHTQHRTLMVLPIVKGRVRSGRELSVYMNRFENFLLLNYHYSAGNFYLDLVSIGETSPTPCSS